MKEVKNEKNVNGTKEVSSGETKEVNGKKGKGKGKTVDVGKGSSME
jgi:hypothetical protein